MIKNSVIALITVAALAGVAAPAMAASAPSGNDVSAPLTDSDTQSFDADRTLVLLQQEGVNATDVEEWGSVLRAFVVDENGQQAMQFFDPDTLAPVNL